MTSNSLKTKPQTNQKQKNRVDLFLLRAPPGTALPILLAGKFFSPNFLETLLRAQGVSTAAVRECQTANICPSRACSCSLHVRSVAPVSARSAGRCSHRRPRARKPRDSQVQPGRWLRQVLDQRGLASAKEACHDSNWQGARLFRCEDHVVFCPCGEVQPLDLLRRGGWGRHAGVGKGLQAILFDLLRTPLASQCKPFWMVN